VDIRLQAGLDRRRLRRRSIIIRSAIVSVLVHMRSAVCRHSLSHVAIIMVLLLVMIVLMDVIVRLTVTGRILMRTRSLIIRTRQGTIVMTVFVVAI